MSGLLSAYSAGLTGATGGNTQAINGKLSGALLSAASRILITNLTGQSVFLTLDGTTPAAPGATGAVAGSFLLPGATGAQRMLGVPAYKNQAETENQVGTTLYAVGAAAWSIFIEAYP